MLRGTLENLERLAGGLVTAIAALLVAICWIVVGAACLVGVGWLLVPAMVATTRATAEWERRRLSRTGIELVSPYTGGRVPGGRRTLSSDPATLRDLSWLFAHATSGLLCGLVGVFLPMAALREISYPLHWTLLPPEHHYVNFGIPVTTWPAAFAACAAGLAAMAGLLRLAPLLAYAQSWPAVRLLAPHPSLDLSERVARLTATRAGALRAHAAELRRIERALHDGTQNRIMAVVVTVAAARRALARDPGRAEHALERAQTAAEQALAELRQVVRGILPPILTDRGLAGALSALAAGCSVPCALRVGELGQLPLSAETTAYFTVAEALTNVCRHSRAKQAEIEVRRAGPRLLVVVRDDGVGGADGDAGTGLTGIRRRVEAHDGTLTVVSPAGGPTVIEMELTCE
ncbi:sensor histidine kinase [Nonomuraea longicatena]|uniref:histidine kinase n=1 Tax=Nonomuraea longicatena TaxID=83682 RepID=A0ABN1QDP1_9ACTN